MDKRRKQARCLPYVTRQLEAVRKERIARTSRNRFLEPRVHMCSPFGRKQEENPAGHCGGLIARALTEEKKSSVTDPRHVSEVHVSLLLERNRKN